MGKQDVNIRINTEADSGKVKDYAEEYANLRAELDETKEKLAELTEQAEENPMLGHRIPELTEEVEGLEDALKKASSQMAKNAGAAKKTGTALKKAGDEGTGLRDALAKARVEMGLADVAAARLKVEVRELAEAEEKAAEAVDENSKSIAKIGTIERAESVGRVADQFGQIATRVRAAGKEIGAFNPELGEMIESMGYAGEVSAELTSSMAAGFAAGGPLGGAIAGIGVAIGKVYENWIEAQKIIAEAEEETQSALEKTIETLEDYGELLGDRRFDRYAERIEGEIKLVDILNRRIQNTINLQRQRAEQDRKNEEAERDFQRDEIDRAVDNNQLGKAEGAAQKGALNLESDAAETLDVIRSARQALEDAQAERKATVDELSAIREELKRFEELRISAQAERDALQGDPAFDFLQKHGKSGVKFIDEAAASAVIKGGELDQFLADLEVGAEALNEKVDLTLDKASKQAQDVQEKQQQLALKVETAGEDFENTVRAESADTAAAVQKVFTEAEAASVDAAKESIEAAQENGQNIEKHLREIPQALRDLYTDSIADSEQRDQITGLIRQLADAGLDQANELSQAASLALEESNKVAIKQDAYFKQVVIGYQKQAAQISDHTRQLQQIQSQISR